MMGNLLRRHFWLLGVLLGVAVITSVADVSTVATASSVACFTSGAGATGNCYEDVGQILSWPTANAAAQARTFQSVNGHLVTITSQAELDFLAANLPPSAFLDSNSFGLGHWIGGVCNNSNCTTGFTWVTGEPVSFTNWCPGEPNFLSPQDSENIHFFTSPCWNDVGAGSAGGQFRAGYVVEYEGPFNQPPDCSGAVPSEATLWPPNHKFVPITITGVTDPDGDPIAINIDSIFQDELTDTFGDGKSTPDGQGVGTNTAQVRAERAGTPKEPGNGRVYHIAFTADDGEEGTCSGESLVGVPFKKKGPPAVDDGAIFDSTVP